MAAIEPLHQRLAAEFRHRIGSGVWAEGEQAPSEAALCDEFGTSRGPVRQALATLRSEGLLVGGQGRSPVVRRNLPSQAASALGSFTAWAHSCGLEPGQRTLIQARIRATVDLAERLQVTPGDPILMLSRIRTLNGTPALREESYFDWKWGRRLMEFDPDSGSVNRFLIDIGADIYASTHQLDAVAATISEATDLGLNPGDPLLRVRRVTTDTTGNIIEYADDRHISGRTTVTVENRLFATPDSHLRAIPLRRDA